MKIRTVMPSGGRSMLLAALICVVPGSNAGAQQMADMSAAGYMLDRVSTVVGVFNGCDRDRQIQLKDGTVFSCGERYRHYAFEPRAQIYRDSLGQNWVFMVDGRAYAGVVTRLGQQISSARRPTSTVAGQSPTGSGAVQPISPLAPLLTLDPTRPIDPGGSGAPNRRLHPTEIGPKND